MVFKMDDTFLLGIHNLQVALKTFGAHFHPFSFVFCNQMLQVK